MFDAQKDYKEYLRQKAIKDNTKKYHTDIIEKWKNKVVATSQNWNYVLQIFSDKSAGLYCQAKPESGCKNCHYCGTDILLYHFKDLKKYEKKERKSIIPADWIILESDFFTALNII